MSEHNPKYHWKPGERDALRHAFLTCQTADELIRYVRASVTDAPMRSAKAYAAELYRHHRDPSMRKSPLFTDLKRLVQEEKKKATSSLPPSEATEEGSWLDEVDPTPSPPVAAPRPVPPPNFVRPDPNARVPQHLPMPDVSQVFFTDRELARFLSVPHATVLDALRSRKIPCHANAKGDAYEITRPVFDVLHATMCEGYSFAEACALRFPLPTPLVSAEQLYQPDAEAQRSLPFMENEQLPPPPAEIHVPEVAAAEQRQWTLEALNEGVLTVEQAFKIAGVTDTPRNRWALGLLASGQIKLSQAAKLLR